MLLVLLRHGIAVDRDDPKCPPEAQRFLTERGVRKTRRVAKGLAAMMPGPVRVWTSPFVRAEQTAKLLLRALGQQPEDALRVPGLRPDQPARDILDEVQRWLLGPVNGFAGAQRPTLSKTSTLVLVGHAPQLDEILAQAIVARSAPTKLKKAGAAGLRMTQIQPNLRAQLEWLLTPKMLAALGKEAAAEP